MSKRRKKLRPIGEIMCDIEKYLFEFHDPEGHDMQHQEVLSQIWWWQQTHVPGQAPVYTSDGSNPGLRFKVGYYPDYGPEKKVKRGKSK